MVEAACIIRFSRILSRAFFAAPGGKWYGRISSSIGGSLAHCVEINNARRLGISSGGFLRKC